MPNPNAEINLIISAEAELSSGMALASRIALRNAFQIALTIVSDKPSTLKEQVKSRLQKLPEDEQALYSVETTSANIDDLITELDSQSLLRVLLLPGLEQLNADRKKLLRRVHATVVCFEAHPGLEQEPQRFWLVGDDHRQFGQWLCEHVAAQSELQSIHLEDLAGALDTGSPEAHGAGDWVLISAAPDRLENAAKQGKAAIEAAVGPVLLIRGEGTWWQWFFGRQLPALAARYLPQMERTDRRELSEKLRKYSKLDFEFVALICSATFLASFGLLQNSAAVIIGAMLVAPLMTPILGAGLSLAHGNRPLFVDSLKTITIGFFAALATSCLVGLLVRFLAPSILEHDAVGRVLFTEEMWSRTHPTSMDFLVGLVGGSAAAFARTRSHLADALAGAAIAAALVPPIATAGLQVSMAFLDIAPTGHSQAAANLMYGPILLFVANMLTIMIGSSFVLWGCGVRAEHGFSRRDRWSTRTMVLLMMLTVACLVWIVQH